MLLYERLIGPAADLDGELGTLRELIRDAVLVVIDNIARFYFVDSSQDEWLFDQHFLNVAPPWPHGFYEYKVPAQIKLRGAVQPNPAVDTRIGLLLSSQSVEELFVERRMRRGDRPFSHEERGLVRETFGEYANSLAWGLADEGAYRAANIGWICQGRLFVQFPHEPLKALHTYFFTVTRQGEVGRRPDGAVDLLSMADDRGDPARREVLRKGATSYLEVPLLAISFLHCKNVGVSDVMPPPKLARAQERRYGIPKVTYKILDIRPMRRVLEEEGGMARGRSSQQALHIVRGHFKTFDDHPLFGKHRGMFWWPMSARGTSDRGLTAKSYRVSVPPDAMPPGART